MIEMIFRIKLLLFFLFLSMLVKANNIRIIGEPVVTANAAKDTVNIQFKLSWDNSWNDLNWDAAWVFVKYRRENAYTAWSHLNLGTSHTLPSDMAYDLGKTSGLVTGVFVYRNGPGAGNLENKEITLKAPVSSFSGVSLDEVLNKKAYIAVSAIEMVCVPYGAYYLGDGVSKNSFLSSQQRMLPPAADIIGTDPTFEYTNLPTPHYKNASPAGAADRLSNSVWTDLGEHICFSSKNQHGANAAYNNSWTVDFKTPRTIRTFGVSGGSSHTLFYPGRTWYLQGSNDQVKWDTVWGGSPELYMREVVSYPIQHAIRVDRPGAYRYYRIFVPQVAIADGTMYANVAMSEKDLYPDATESFLVESEQQISLGKMMNQLYANDGDTWTGALSVNYPKGYRGFYCMKYELSQEQYVSFLNMLSRTQQAARIGNKLDDLQQGEYVFGDKSRPNARNGICVYANKAGKPAVFANNLTADTVYYGPNDGQTIACNYLTPEDMLAYSDWAGLRPMSEMEYEKACRRPSPQFPVTEEYAWNDRTFAPFSGSADLQAAGSETEKVTNNKNVNAGNTFGPVRCGSFGVGATLQKRSGGAFWGAMEMSGNLGEICYNAASAGRAYNAVDPNLCHGNGVLPETGIADMTSYWPAGTTAAAFAVRGGSFSSNDSLLRVSDRQILKVTTVRDSTLGFRAVRTIGGFAVTMQPGAIVCDNGTALDTACPGVTYVVRNATAASVKNSFTLPVSYQWYVNDILVPGATGEELSYRFENAGTAVVEYTVKRKALCVAAEAPAVAATTVKIKVPNTVIRFNARDVNVDFCNLSVPIKATPVNTGITMNYKWTYSGRTIGVGAEYYPSRDQFDGAAGLVDVYCETSLLGCEVKEKMNIWVSEERAVASNAVTMENCGSVLAIDSRDNKRYCTVKIVDQYGDNAQCWFGRNLNVGEWKKYPDYSAAHTVTGIQKVCYGDLELNCDKYGALYNWYEGMYGGKTDGNKMNGENVQGICPDGWHVGSDEEWKRMEMNLGMTRAAADAGPTWARGTDEGKKITYPGFPGATIWCTGAECNSSGFNARISGYIAQGTGFTSIDKQGCFWQSTASGTSHFFRCVDVGYTTIHRGGNANQYGMNIRCLKD